MITVPSTSSELLNQTFTRLGAAIDAKLAALPPVQHPWQLGYTNVLGLAYTSNEALNTDWDIFEQAIVAGTIPVNRPFRLTSDAHLNHILRKMVVALAALVPIPIPGDTPIPPLP